jgi:hypothetical protein
MMSLLCGGIFKEVNKKFGIPYTPMVLILGVILGVYHAGLGEWGHAAFTI